MHGNMNVKKKLLGLIKLKLKLRNTNLRFPARIRHVSYSVSSYYSYYYYESNFWSTEIRAACDRHFTGIHSLWPNTKPKVTRCIEI